MCGGSRSSLRIFREMHRWMPEIRFLSLSHDDIWGFFDSATLNQHDHEFVIIIYVSSDFIILNLLIRSKMEGILETSFDKQKIDGCA